MESIIESIYSTIAKQAEQAEQQTNESIYTRSDWSANETESSAGADVITMFNKHRKKYGFLSYDPDSDACFAMTFDSSEDLMELYAVDINQWEGIEKTKIGDVYIDIHNSLYMRIW